MNIEKSTINDELQINVDIIKQSSILFDGKQFLIKIPKEISEFYGIKSKKHTSKTDYKFKFNIKPQGKGKGEAKFEIVKDG